jgi:hypothetical protein
MINVTDRNVNLLSEGNFQIDIPRLKYLNPHVTGANIPALTLPNVFIKTGLTALPNPSDNIEWASLSVSFLVDEEMHNWFEIYDWIVGLGFPESQTQFDDWMSNYKSINAGTFDDATLVVYTNKKNPAVEVTFKNIVPLYLSEVAFRTDTQNEFLPCTVNFAVETYSYRRVSKTD